ncbi:hypothetical protein WAZ07_04315 [Bacillus sp. FJAT-51639]|uniref:Uncharacterized protein n=1 Tax=Bacillus bruguierae TaxID=3127667 RepID=A0ABU8FD01_9BACI
MNNVIGYVNMIESGSAHKQHNPKKAVTTEDFERLQLLVKYCEAKVENLKNDPTRNIASKEIQAEKETRELDKFYEEHVAKHGNTL